MFFVPPNIPPVPDEITARFGQIIDWLRRAIAARAGMDRSIVPMMVLLYGRLGRTIRRFEVLIAKIRAGQLPPPPRDPATRSLRQPTEIPPDKPALRLPTHFNWLGRMGPDIHVYGSQLAHLLTDPEMRAMLGTDPRVGRILRPLLRMLGVDPATAGVPPPPPRRPRAPPTPTLTPPPAKPAGDAQALTPATPPEVSVNRRETVEDFCKRVTENTQTHVYFITIS